MFYIGLNRIPWAVIVIRNKVVQPYARPIPTSSIGGNTGPIKPQQSIAEMVITVTGTPMILDVATIASAAGLRGIVIIVKTHC